MPLNTGTTLDPQPKCTFPGNCRCADCQYWLDPHVPAENICATCGIARTNGRCVCTTKTISGMKHVNFEPERVLLSLNLPLLFPRQMDIKMPDMEPFMHSLGKHQDTPTKNPPFKKRKVASDDTVSVDRTNMLSPTETGGEIFVSGCDI